MPKALVLTFKPAGETSRWLRILPQSHRHFTQVSYALIDSRSLSATCNGFPLARFLHREWRRREVLFEPTIAYFSMEIGLHPAMPTYAGGLGVLAGDTIRSAADLEVSMVGVTLLHRKGYFYQRLDSTGWQTEAPAEWVVDDFLVEIPERASVAVNGRTVEIRCWKYEVEGVQEFKVPVYFLDTDLETNAEQDRKLTDFLYGGDSEYRLRQEVVLGMGGVKMLRALGYHRIERFHMNEGHSALLTIALLKERLGGRASITQDDVDDIRKRCVFTTHTPVPAGQDQFPMDLANRVLGDHEVTELKHLCCHEGALNLTYLALNLSRYVNGVAMKHGEVSTRMFAGYTVDAITNGVHAATWTSEPFQNVFDRHISGWKADNFSLRYALGIPTSEIWEAHVKAKRALIEYVNHETNAGMDVDYLTLGFARRATPYKRADLLFQGIERLKTISASAGRFQVVYAGKAHPRDEPGKHLIQRIIEMKERLKEHVKVAYLENYDMNLGRMMVAGVDVWLNTPQPPLEASGTSGMKAALNGVPSLSVLDGWWIEGCIEGVTGWAIGPMTWGPARADERSEDANSLYEKLEQVIVPMFYRDRDRFIDVMRHAIALNGSFFNTQRMLQEYVLKAYRRGNAALASSVPEHLKPNRLSFGIQSDI